MKDRSLCLLQVYAPNAVNKYQVFVDDVNEALQRVGSTETITLLGDFNAHIGTDSKTWKGVIDRHGDPAFNENGQYLLQLCCSNKLCIINIFFQHRDVHKYTWYRPSMVQKFLKDFRIVSSDLFSKVLDIREKQGAELSTDQHLVVCSQRFLKPWLKRKLHRSSVAYSIKWEALADRDERKQFASSMTAKFQQLTEISEDIEMEWSLLQTAMISSAVKSCGRKQLRVKNSAAQAVKISKNALGRNLVISWIPTIHQQTRYFGRAFADCMGKVIKEPLTTSNKDSTGNILLDEKEILSHWREYFKDLLNPVRATHTDTCDMVDFGSLHVNRSGSSHTRIEIRKGCW